MSTPTSTASTDLELDPVEQAWRRAFPEALEPTRFGREGSSANSGWTVCSLELSGVKNLPEGILEAAWAVVLGAYSGELALTFATLVQSEELRVVPLRITLEPSLSRATLVERVAAERTAAMSRSAISASRLRAVLGVESSRWVETLVASDRAALDATLREFEGSLGIAFDAGSLWLQFSSGKLDAAAAQRLLGQLWHTLEALAAGSEPLGTLEFIDASERNLLLETWNETRRDDGRAHDGVHELFSAIAARSPEVIAVVADDATLSYAELDARSNRFARRLKALGIGRESCVAICLERSAEQIVALLGILKAGGAYVPLELGYPRERLAGMLRDVDARLVITRRALRSELPETAATWLLLDDELDQISKLDASAIESDVNAESLAYVIFTSGSTGEPKGVEVPHRAIRRLCCEGGYARLDPSTVVLQAAPVAFDASTLEIWGPLLNGGKLVVYGERVPTAQGLGDAIRKHGVNCLWLTAALFNAIIDEDPDQLRGVRELLVGGEALSVAHIRKALAALPGTQLLNGYGPTETTTFATTHRISAADVNGASIPIGRPIRDTQLYVLDTRGKLVPLGGEGELHIGGAGVARGYRNREALTAERFVKNPFGDGRLYRTGDWVRYRSDGALEFVARRDAQVKIRGFRIELGEIELAIAQHPAIRSARVLARPGPGGKRLVAYLVAKPDVVAPTNLALTAFLTEQLPDQMVPTSMIWLAQLPITANGKLDTRALPEPDRKRPDLEQPYAAPRTSVEKKLCAVWAELLGIDRVGALDSFFSLGGTSLLAIQAVARLKREHQLDVPVLEFFKFPTAASLAAAIEGSSKPATSVQRRQRSTGALDAVAIVGMAGRFPGADSVEAFWKNLCAGVESIRNFEDAELDPSISPSQRRDPAYVKARGVVSNVELFDAAFFGINPKEAALMDPQQRLLLQVSWEALESSGYVPERISGTVGVFAGKYNDGYYAENVVRRPDLVAEIGAFQTMVLNEKDYVATHLAHRLDLRGPAVSVHTACSTSLVAVAQAFDSLRLGHCDFALAGGASIVVPVMSGYLYQEGAMLSPDGHCRPFDAQAQGTTFSDGVAMICLKRLADALADGDTIHAVIRGAAINNDGAAKASFTAPSVAGQAAVITRALEIADVEPRSIGYVEAHGTATPLGDPIEIAALTQAFSARTPDTGFCKLGSVKSNVGHLVIAAGATGLIKVALSLRNELIPPTLHFKSPNPAIDFARSPFSVVDTLTPWRRGLEPRRAGVSSFGVGGTNAHAVVEEAPAEVSTSAGRSEQLIVLSARTETALEAATARLADHLEANPEIALADVAHTLQLGRRQYAQRRAVSASNAQDASAALRSFDARRVFTQRAAARPPGVAFLFPGQGAQYAGMGSALYAREPLFRGEIDRGAEELRSALGLDLRDALLSVQASDSLRETRLAQPALFVIEYALARLWLSWGVQPKALIGHSVGEFVGAALAGVMSRHDALRLVALRGELMQALPSGAMLSVRLPAAEIEQRLPAGLELAADNGPSLCVIAGPTERIAEFERKLEVDGVITRRLVTSHAFHSSMMEAAIAPFRAEVERVKLAAPELPMVSTLSGTWLTTDEARDPNYWARHLREPVRFAPAMRTALVNPELALLEVGPRATLTTLAKQQSRERIALASLGDGTNGADEVRALLTAAGRLWLAGVNLDFAALHSGERRRRVPLPTYCFDLKRFWVEPTRTELIEAVPKPSLEPTMPTQSSRIAGLTRAVKDLLEESSGNEIGDGDIGASFMELGLDSLFLTQLALALSKKFAIKISFRELMEQFPSVSAVAEHLDRSMPADARSTPVNVVAALTTNVASSTPVAPQPTSNPPPGTIQALVAEQLRVMTQQLALLTGTPMPSAPTPAPVVDDAPIKPEPYDPKKAFGAIARIHVNRSEELSPKQKSRLDALIRRYTARTAASKRFTQENRSHMADPRVVTGFRPAVKELVYPIVVQRSAGSKLWDLDGNSYVDTLNGFGCNLFGWQPEFVTRAVIEQLQTGHEIGPQTPLAAEAAKLVCEFTGFDRAAFCNTGSEAVMGCVRVARTVTGRTKIAMFTGSYHGIFDEVIVRGTKKLKSFPAAPGIMANTAENVLVLDYGTPESLEILREHAHELAAVLIEPVQSRRPDFQPREFLKSLREITEKSGTVYIFDEVITGFRTGPGGAQEHFGIRADMASYGKVVGGGLPVGIIAGKREYMDALDGGSWQFGDASVPTVGVTYFAGTFVRHPLALAAVKAVLLHLRQAGPGLQRELTARTQALADELNAFCDSVGAPIHIKHFSSLWKTFYTAEQSMGDLLFFMLRDRGVHIYDGFPCFLTTAHSEADVALIVKAFKESVIEMQESGFLPPSNRPRAPQMLDANAPPVAGARLGRDPQGNPAWFLPSAVEPGKYVQLDDGDRDPRSTRSP